MLSKKPEVLAANTLGREFCIASFFTCSIVTGFILWLVCVMYGDCVEGKDVIED